MGEDSEEELLGQAAVDEGLVVLVEDAGDLPAVAATASGRRGVGVAVGVAGGGSGRAVAVAAQGVVGDVDLAII